MEKQFELEFVGQVTISDTGEIRVYAKDGTNFFINRNFDVMVTNFLGDTDDYMRTWMTFEQFVKEMSNNQYLQGNANKAFFCWIEMFYVQQYLELEPTYSLDKLLWEKTYEFDGAVTKEERLTVIAGWHVFTDGKEFAVIWSSECCCEEIVPLIGKEIVFMNCETAVIRL